MDIARGSRRARNVAANAAVANTRARQGATNTPGAADQDAAVNWPLPAGDPPPHLSETRVRRRRQPQQQQHHVTPEGNALSDSRTPNQHGLGQRRARASPPPNPFRLHRTANANTQPRLSMPMDSDDDSGSEPDLSVLGMARPAGNLRQRIVTRDYDDDDNGMLQESLDGDELEEAVQEGEAEEDAAEDASVEEELEAEVETEQAGNEVSAAPPLTDPAALGLKEISNLGKFTVSSHKQGNGMEELRSDDLKQYWQSDGPQPHKLTVYFVKRVGIRDIRFYVDYNEDESYTPTKIVFRSGTSENNLIKFATMNLESPVGWQQVPLAGAGGDPDGNTLVSYVLQMQILENHQNGKDTHLRGIKIYAFDGEPGLAGQPRDNELGVRGDAGTEATANSRDGGNVSETARLLAVTRLDHPHGGFTIPDFMKEAELR